MKNLLPYLIRSCLRSPNKGLLAIAIIFISYSSANAQFYSKRIPLLAQTNGYISSIQIVNDTIYAMCQINDTILPYYSIALFLKFDMNGSILSKTTFNIPNRTGIEVNFNNLIRTNDGGFAYGGWTSGLTQTTNSVLILKYDKSGNFQWYKEIVDTTYLGFYCEAFAQDKLSNYYLTGSFTHPITNDNDDYLLKLDSMGNLIYKKEFDHPNIYNEAVGICINRKGNIVIGGDAFVFDVNDLSTAKDYTEIYELDTGGNQVNYFLGSDTNGPQASNFLLSNDGGYLIASSYFCYLDVYEDKWQGAIAKIDSNFNKVWSIDIGLCSQNTAFYTNTLCSDGNYIVTGESFDDSDTFRDHKNGWIVKYNDQGQILWSKLYRGISSNGFNGDENTIYSLGFLTDGSILCAGQAINYDDTINSQQGWLLHLDTLGCLPDSNSCGITDGIDKVPEGTVHVRAYPNPAGDRISIEVDMNQSVPYTVSISNILGQNSYKANLSAQSTMTDIDLRQWPAGLYLYSVSSNGISVTGKFVVSH